MALTPGHHVTASMNNAGSSSHQLRHFSLSRSSSSQHRRGGMPKKASTSYHTLTVRAGRPKKSTPTNHVEHHCEVGSTNDSSSLKAPSLPPKLGLQWLDNGGALTGLKMEELVRGGHGMLLGSRIPKHYFMVKGFGETDQGDGSDPWETGSYDLALEDAGNTPSSSSSSRLPPRVLLAPQLVGCLNQCWGATWPVMKASCVEKTQ